MSQEEYEARIAERKRLRKLQEVAELPKITTIIKTKLSGRHRPRFRFIYIFTQLLNCPPGDKVLKKDLVKKCNVTDKTVQRDMTGFFRRFRLVKRVLGGYRPTDNFTRLTERLAQENPEIYTTLKGEPA
jgi:hypothetical protein